MLTFDTQDCAVLKQALQILKVEVVSVRATKGTVLFCLHNRNTGLLLLHKVRGQVDQDQDFGMNSERFLALLTSGTLTLTFDGSAVSYKNGRRHGTVETCKPFFEPWPDLKQTGVAVQEIFEEFRFLNLKSLSKNNETFIFGGTFEGTPAVAAGDSEHAVFMPLQKSSPFSLPLGSIAGAQRIYKQNVNVTVDAGTIYFQSSGENWRSILRFGQIGETDRLNLEAFGRFKSAPVEWSASIDASLFIEAIAEYKLIVDSERVGTLNLEIKDQTVKLTGKTRHGTINLEGEARGDPGEVTLNIELLKDICRLEDTVRIGLKNSGRVFFISNEKATYFSAVA